MSLTKDDIVQALARENGYPLNQSMELIETLIELIKSKLASGEDVLISRFGKFCVKDKRERRGRNPATGEGMMLEPRRVVTFRRSRTLRDKINQLRRAQNQTVGLSSPFLKC
jgi:integration host factor subunit alpha